MLTSSRHKCAMHSLRGDAAANAGSKRTKIRSASHPSLAVAAPHPAFVVRLVPVIEPSRSSQSLSLFPSPSFSSLSIVASLSSWTTIPPYS